MELGDALKLALAAGVPANLAANILTTSNTVRLRRYFTEVGQRFLASHKRVLTKQTGPALKERNRLKALLTLIRARRAQMGVRKSSVAQELRLLDKRTTPILLVSKSAQPARLAA